MCGESLNARDKTGKHKEFVCLLIRSTFSFGSEMARLVSEPRGRDTLQLKFIRSTFILRNSHYNISFLNISHVLRREIKPHAEALNTVGGRIPL